VANQKIHHLRLPFKNHLLLWSLLPHLFRKIGHRYVNKEMKQIKIIQCASIISDPDKMLTSRAVKSANRWPRPNSGKSFICRNHPQKNSWRQASATKILIHTGVLHADVLQQLV